jgi:periplasmic divalent cation tolerance protein
MDARVVLTTFPDLEQAQKIARLLVVEGLAACVNLLPGAHSIYQWEGAVQGSAEVAGILKTTANRVSELQARYLELHPYEVPEFIVLTPESVSPAYLEWIGCTSVNPDVDSV